MNIHLINSRAHSLRIIAPVILGLSVFSLLAEETASLIPPPHPTTSPVTAPAPSVLAVSPDQVLSTRTIARPDQTLTIQEITPQELAPLPPVAPPPTLTPEQIAQRTARLAQRGNYRVTALSCDIHHLADHSVRSRITWTSQGKIPVQSFECWSNINFQHLSQTTSFKKADTTHSLMLFCRDVHNHLEQARAARRNLPYTAPTIPPLPADPTTTPTFIVTRGTPTEEDLAVITGLHELYQQHHAAFIRKVEQIKQHNARIAAELAANPPDPTPDLIIRHWLPENTPTPTTNQEIPTNYEEEQTK